ncbi:MAG: cation transporter [Candidatus Rokubacteria bacterium]|nr:cation transporter [Candidatus Rokubacteria bacterium]
MNHHATHHRPPDPPGHGHDDAHYHHHGIIDPAIASTDRGMWALKWSFFGLLATALFQLVVVVLSGSVALFADTIHNFADAATAIPLAIAFAFARLKPSRRFPYGYGRVEDLAGVLIVATILITALIAGYESLLRLLRPQPVGHLWAVAGASVVGFLGNEAVAFFRIKVGREIASAALVADGYHARADGLTSLAVLVGAIGVWLGYPLADPMAGLLITVAILHLVWQSARAVFTRMLDGVEPEVLDAAEHAARHVPGVHDVAEVRARWIGHRLTLELNVAVNPDLTVTEGHGVAKEVQHQVLHHVPHASGVTVHVDPGTESGETFHHIGSHAHDGLPVHAHR